MSLTPDFVIYTDAATSTSILAAVIYDQCVFLIEGVAEWVLSEVSEPDWATFSDHTTYIYGLEMLAILQTALATGELLMGGNVVFYIDNSNSMGALIRGSPDTLVIRKMAQLFRKRAQDLEISVWLEKIPSWINIADLPTRFAPFL